MTASHNAMHIAPHHSASPSHVQTSHLSNHVGNLSHTGSSTHVGGLSHVSHANTSKSYPGKTSYKPTKYVGGGASKPTWHSASFAKLGWKSAPVGWHGKFGHSYCIAPGYCKWSYNWYCARYGCNLYYDPCTSGWYFWERRFSVYVPYTYINYYCTPAVVETAGVETAGVETEGDAPSPDSTGSEQPPPLPPEPMPAPVPG
jgi:hypothetical protein